MHTQHPPARPTPEEIDEAMHRDKQADGYGQRQQAQAMRLQLKQQQKAKGTT